MEEIKSVIFPPGSSVMSRDKRNGRLVLLTGPSGVGKTYQASKLVEGFGAGAV